MIRELRREALRLCDTQHDSELLCSQQENAVCRKRIQELESERVTGLQMSITPSPLRSTLATSTSIYDQPMVFPVVDPSVNANSDQLTPTVDNLLPCLESDSSESADFDTHTSTSTLRAYTNGVRYHQG